MEIWQSVQGWLPTVSLGDIQLAWPVWVPAGFVSLLGGAYFLLQLWNNLKEFFAPEAATKKSQDELKAQMTDLHEDLAAQIAALASKVSQKTTGQPDAASETTDMVERAFRTDDTDALDAFREIASGKIDKGYDDLEAQAKSAETSGDVAKASLKWFDLGQLTRDPQPRRAMKAFEHVLRLNQPEHVFWAAYFLSNFYLTLDGNVSAAGDMAEKAKAAASDNREKSLALLISGDVKHKRRDYDAARDAFSAGIAAVETLAEAKGYTAQDYRDTGTLIDRIASTYLNEGKLDPALVFFQKSVEISEKLVSFEGADKFDHRDLAQAKGRLANIYLSQGNVGKASETVSDELNLAEKLWQEEPNSALFQRDLLFAKLHQGDLAMLQAKPEDARSSYLEAEKLSLELASNDTETLLYRRDLVHIYEKLAAKFPNEASTWISKALDAQKDIIAAGKAQPEDFKKLETLQAKSVS